MDELYEVDPDGDLLIVLALPPTPVPFAPWPNLVSQPRQDLTKDTQPTGDDADVLSTGPSRSNPALRLKVSSKHLSLASGYFKKMLGGGWAEASTVHHDGCRHVDLEDFDADAIKILMDVIHGRAHNVPRSVDLDLLAKIAILVDYFGCQQVVAIVSDIWIQAAKRTISTHLDRGLILWILIASVFHKQEIFKSVTRVAIVESSSPIPTLGLPIRDKIVSTLSSSTDCRPGAINFHSRGNRQQETWPS